MTEKIERKNDVVEMWPSGMKYAFGMNSIITRILGIWPPDCKDIFPKIQVGFVALLQILMIMTLIGEVMSDCSSISEIAEVISLVVCAILTFVKVVLLRVFDPKMLDIIKSAINDWSTVKTPQDREIMIRYAKRGRFVFMFHMGSAYATTMPMIIGALPFLAPKVNITGMNESEIAGILEPVPIGTGCLFGNFADHTIFYSFIFSLQAIMLLSTCTGNIGTDAYFFGIAMHMCGQFKLLGLELENFEIDESVDEQTCEEKLVKIIGRHVRLLDLAEYLEDSFNFIILVQISANGSQMCLMGIQMLLSLQAGNTVTIVNTFIIFYVMSLQIFLYSYAGDCLTSEIDQIRISAYFFPWYTLRARLGKIVLFMMMRNYKSFNITAGKVYRMDIDNFKNMIKALGSYFSVLRMMFDA